MDTRQYIALGLLGASALVAILVVANKPAPRNATASSAPREVDLSRLPNELTLTAVIRDFKGADESGGHPDFESFSGTTRVGLVSDLLDRDGKPVLASKTGRQIVKEYEDADGNPINPALFDPQRGDKQGELKPMNDIRITSEESFNQWYHNVPNVNAAKAVALVMRRIDGTNRYVFDSKTDEPWKSRGGFYPINDDLFGNYARTGKNYHFTTELSTRFVYHKGAGDVFKFTGDDDVWVFIDGRLVIDLGSLHSKKEQTLELDRLDWLRDGKIYELKVFHAERHTTESNFRIETTLELRKAKLPNTSNLYD
ncbi:MAG: fibro-slime domain-containing protein [Phycisphaerales bacterium]|nr:fibro-slime domain-containing protein [Phycisphaerales bacterium]